MSNPMLTNKDTIQVLKVKMSEDKKTFVKDLKGKFIYAEKENEVLYVNTIEGQLTDIRLLDNYTFNGGMYYTIQFVFSTNEYETIFETFFNTATSILNNLASISSEKIGLVKLMIFPKKDKNDPEKIYSGFVVSHNTEKLDWKYKFNELPTNKDERESFWIKVLQKEILIKMEKASNVKTREEKKEEDIKIDEIDLDDIPV